MKRLRATVKRATGATIHSIGAIKGGAPASLARIPDPIAVEIIKEDGAFFLFRLDKGGVCLADTWHQTLDEAKAQAKLEYGVDGGDWVEV